MKYIISRSTGPYQPSHEMMLKFYGFYKQATEGPVNIPEPSFWEVVKKAKYNAWKKLGDMTEEEAMRNYVEELKKVRSFASTMNLSGQTTKLSDNRDHVVLHGRGNFHRYHGVVLRVR